MKLLAALTPLVFAAAASATTDTLYNGSLGTSPQSQGKLSYYTLPGTGVETIGATSTTYNSTANFNEHGGFSNDNIFGTPVDPSFPALDKSVGYSLDLSLQKLAEDHGTDNNRSGTSLIVLGADHTGIELEFWNNEVWAQSGADFVHAEGVAFNTTAAITAYHLAVSGSTYTLSINGTLSLSGSLRDYSAFGFPYTLSNYLFLGDDTGSASGAFAVSSLSVTTPEPGMMMTLLAGTALALRRTSRKRLG